MAQLPFELQKLPPQALDVLRFFIANENEPADDVDIMDGADLSERSFSKAIKRLVTKKFAEMDVMRRYTLTDKGVDLMHELAKYDAENGGKPAENEPDDEPAVPASTDPIERRLTLVLAEPLVVGESAQVFLGVDAGIPDHETELVLRLQVLNGEPDRQEAVVPLTNGAGHTAFQVTAGEYRQVRLRVEALQADEYSGDLHTAGGMYVDVDVTQDNDENGQLVAYGTGVHVLPM